MKEDGKQLPKVFPIKPEKISKDKLLEELFFKTQMDISRLERLLCDYIFMGTNSLQYPNITERSKEDFYTNFEDMSNELDNDIRNILDSFLVKKQLDDYTLFMKLLDPRAPMDNSWFRYHFIIMHRVFGEYKGKILTLKDGGYPYKDFYLLEGYTTFLREMCFDISFFVYKYYILKAREYAGYVSNQQMKIEENPFVRFNNMPKMSKTHKADSRSLFNTTEGVLHRTFYKDDVHATPIVTFLIRQMIELRMEECLGIQVIFEDKEHTAIKKVVGSTYLELPSLEDASVFPIPLDMIRRIYSWASEYVHRGVSDEYWIIYYVRKYLLDFILGTVYMKLDYFNRLRDTIASHFNVSKECIIWRNQPINLCPVSDNELKEIGDEIKRKGYSKFRENEWKRDEERMKLYMKKHDIYKELRCKKTFLYKIGGKYYIISNQIFEVCSDDEIIADYESIFKEIEMWETKCGKKIRTERLGRRDLSCFVPQFNRIRAFCDTCEERAVREIEPNKCTIPDNTELKKEVDRKLNNFFVSLSQKETESFEKQLTDMAWLCEQSIKFETYGL